jgi:16S rRNA (cytidine1402-2'-O)-methyltransferase
MDGTLYLCATPIGNLGDLTERVCETLREVDLIAAEDTRQSIRLLNVLNIKTPLTSYHEHNKYEKGEQLLIRLKAGENIALITDAGTPAISDPGTELVARCHQEGITVTSLPGPSALITALSLSGLETRRFCFEGFLPADKKKRKTILTELATESRTIILYEAPHRIRKTLADLVAALGDRALTICRELTKKFETVTPTTLSAALAFHEENEPRGEYVLVLAGCGLKEKQIISQHKWREMPLICHMEYYEKDGIPEKEAMKLVARDRGTTKREVYQTLIKEKLTIV